MNVNQCKEEQVQFQPQCPGIFPFLRLQIYATHAEFLRNFFSVVCESEILSGNQIKIGNYCLVIQESDLPTLNLGINFDGLESEAVEIFFQRAKFYHFRESPHCRDLFLFQPPELQNDNGILIMKWCDWDGRDWIFSSAKKFIGDL